MGDIVKREGNVLTQFKYRKTWGPTPKYERVESYISNEDRFIAVAGPCFAESREVMEQCARVLSGLGVKYLRGGVFRAGTYPPDDFGLQESKLQIMSEVALLYGMRRVVEVLDYTQPTLDLYAQHSDAFQVGCRQMQNYNLLKRLGEYKRRVFLKRNPGATVDEWLGAAEYLLKYGSDVVLVERGSITHMDHVRYDLSVSAIAAVKKLTDIPVIVDPSHGTGRRDLVKSMLMAGVAAGAVGCLIEAHPEPAKSLSDADQAYPLAGISDLLAMVHRVYKAVNVTDQEIE